MEARRRGNRRPESDFGTQAPLCSEGARSPRAALGGRVLTNSGLGLPTLHRMNAVKTDVFEVLDLNCLKERALLPFLFFFLSYYYLWSLFPWRLGGSLNLAALRAVCYSICFHFFFFSPKVWGCEDSGYCLTRKGS